MGRPRKPEAEQRSERVAFRVSPDEFAMLEAGAKRTGLTVGSYARQVAIRGRVIVQEGKGLTPEAFTALQRIGVNLNQLARASNEGRGVDSISLHETLAELNHVLAEGIAHDSARR